jgi:hypothetical protein
MDRLWQLAIEGGIYGNIPGDMRMAVNTDLQDIEKLCHQCGSQVFAVLKEFRGEKE